MSGKGTSFSEKAMLDCRGKKLDLSTPAVMGILNITPDSFYDGGKYKSEKDLLIQTENMLEEGAAVIDIGAVSTRPGAPDVPPETEHNRLTAVLNLLIRRFPEAIFSVDTYRSEIARWAVERGAGIINDISGGTFDSRMLETIAGLKVPYIIMHIQGVPGNMQQNPVYENVVHEVDAFFMEQAEKLRTLNFEKIILDPGFGFGKNLEHNFSLLKNLAVFKKSGYPVMAGISRKSMINKLLKTTPETALNGTTAANTIALLNGANILRVHDVKEAMQCIKVVQKLKEVE